MQLLNRNSPCHHSYNDSDPNLSHLVIYICFISSSKINPSFYTHTHTLTHTSIYLQLQFTNMFLLCTFSYTTYTQMEPTQSYAKRTINRPAHHDTKQNSQIQCAWSQHNQVNRALFYSFSSMHSTWPPVTESADWPSNIASMAY